MITAIAGRLLMFSVLMGGLFAESAPNQFFRQKVEERKGDWAELEKQGFHQWRLQAFTGWSMVADGGSMAFFFRTTAGDEFDVLVAHPGYWSPEDIEAKRQAIYLLKNRNRFFPVVPESKREQTLVRMLQALVQDLPERGRLSKPYAQDLIATIKDREPVPHDWPKERP
jgi:hypothetical protein